MVDLETIEALYENVSMKEHSVECNKTKGCKVKDRFKEMEKTF